MGGLEMNVLVAKIADRLIARKYIAATAESCTGGLIAHKLTNMAGSSNWYKGGIVAYSNELKQSLLHVPEQVLQDYGAVSKECVSSMVKGLCRALRVQTGVAVSGIAGPGGGTELKPVGTVWIAWQVGDFVENQKFLFTGSRQEIKFLSAQAALQGLLTYL